MSGVASEDSVRRGMKAMDNRAAGLHRAVDHQYERTHDGRHRGPGNQLRWIRVDGGHAVPTNILQVGLEIRLSRRTERATSTTTRWFYISNNPELVSAFNQAGVPALLDPTAYLPVYV